MLVVQFTEIVHNEIACDFTDVTGNFFNIKYVIVIKEKFIFIPVFGLRKGLSEMKEIIIA